MDLTQKALVLSQEKEELRAAMEQASRDAEQALHLHEQATHEARSAAEAAKHQVRACQALITCLFEAVAICMAALEHHDCWLPDSKLAVCFKSEVCEEHATSKNQAAGIEPPLSCLTF